MGFALKVAGCSITFISTPGFRNAFVCLAFVKDYRNGSREHSARGAVNWALPSKLQVVRSRSFPHPVSEMHLFSDYLSSITHVHILVNVLLLLLFY